MRVNTEQPDAEDAKESQRTPKEQPPIQNECSHEVIGAAVEVQRVLGVGLLESAYANALAIEFDQRGLRYQREVPIGASYKGHDVGVAYRADFIVEDSVVVELKAQDGVADAHRRVARPARVCGEALPGRLGRLGNGQGSRHSSPPIGDGVTLSPAGRHRSQPTGRRWLSPAGRRSHAG